MDSMNWTCRLWLGMVLGCGLAGSILAASLPEVPPGTARMIEQLRAITRQGDPNLNLFRNAERAELLRAALDLAPSPNDRFQLQSSYARELLNSGRSKAGLKELIRAQAMLPDLPQLNVPENRALMRILIATAHLRSAEQLNCLSNHNADSCLFPLRGGGIHNDKTGGRAAIEELTQLLQESPDNLEARWLLNIAHMTVGDYPDKVPEAWRIPPQAFASDYDIGRFPDIAGGLGLDLEDLSGGAVVDDFNGDSYLDLMVSSMGLNAQLRLFLNQRDGTFADKTREALLLGLTGGLNMVQADYDNDGDVDVLVLRGGWMREGGLYPSSLLRNQGDGIFADVTEQAGLARRRPTQSAVWLDFNGDGWLDLFVAAESAGKLVLPCELYRGNGDGTFTECARSAGVARVGFVKAVAAGDYNNDGRTDLYLSLLGRPNVLYRNDGPRVSGAGPKGDWVFTDVSQSAGAVEPMYSFPCWFFDFDNDGWLDLYSGGYSIQDVGQFAAEALGLPHKAERSRLYRNNRQGGFDDVSEVMGVRKLLHGMGANFGDLDNDGWLDFYIGTGNPDFGTLIPNRMFRNDAGRKFQDVTTSGGFGHLQKGHAVVFADLDNDGDQDVYHDLGGAFEGDVYRNALFENPGHGNRWITLKLEGVKSNRSALGARIEVVVREGSGTRSIHRSVGSGGSFGASPLRQEIGLGRAEGVEEIRIRWPSGEVSRFSKVTMERFYSCREGESELKEMRIRKTPFKLVPPAHAHGAAR